jgi:hypothetical protein
VEDEIEDSQQEIQILSQLDSAHVTKFVSSVDISQDVVLTQHVWNEDTMDLFSRVLISGSSWSTSAVHIVESI